MALNLDRVTVIALLGILISTNWATHEATKLHINDQISQAYENGEQKEYREVLKPEQTLQIRDYTVKFMDENHPEMTTEKGRAVLGYTFPFTEGDIYLREDMTIPETYTTCVHEHLHDLGISEEHHRYIERWSKQIRDPVCLKAVKISNQTGGKTLS